MFKNIEACSKIIREIISETNGDFENMTYSQKLTIIRIMREYKKQIDKFMINDYYQIKMWANLDLDEVKLAETKCDYTKLNKIKMQLAKM